jgi:hypothetical protein
MGGGTGLGGEDGRAHGGAVSLGVRRIRSCDRSVSVFVVVLAASFAACTGPNAAPAPDSAALLQSIPVADPEKYPSPQTTKHWSNPYLVIRSDRVELLTQVAANEEQIIKPEEALKVLAALPVAAWPYGRVVAILVEKKAKAPEADMIALRRNRGIVEGDLESAHVAIQWIPSS